MDQRTQTLLAIRPHISGVMIFDTMSADERFQNITLRPILKLQNDLFLEVFRNYANKHKGVFFNLPLERQLGYIENAIQKDIKFRNSLKGIVIGQFTREEYLSYIENSSNLNKRMMNMVIERLKDQIQLLAGEKVA